MRDRSGAAWSVNLHSSEAQYQVVNTLWLTAEVQAGSLCDYICVNMRCTFPLPGTTGRKSTQARHYCIRWRARKPFTDHSIIQLTSPMFATDLEPEISHVISAHCSADRELGAKINREIVLKYLWICGVIYIYCVAFAAQYTKIMLEISLFLLIQVTINSIWLRL